MKMRLFLVPLLVTSFAFALSLWSSQAGREPSQEPILQTAAGELSKVDPESQSLWIKAADGSEMQFKYTDNTQVTGAADSAEGLANKNGSRVSVQFSKVGDANVAAKIEVLGS
jgi:hypothetical protein